MREIKFRVWDKKRNNMIILDRMWHCGEYASLAFGGDINFDFGYIDDINGYKVMQFTGLKDKNGKEIYEGDILAAPHTYNIEIIYRNGSFLMKFFDDIGEKCEYHLSKELIEQDDLEIIGNKYENPELLGDVNECSRWILPRKNIKIILF